MVNSTKFDKIIKTAVNTRANEINPSEDMFSKISSQINLNEENENMKFKMKKSGKAIAIACCMLILISVTAYAAKNYLRAGYYSNAYTSFPSETQVKKDAHFLPSYVKNFENGFTFERASIGEDKAVDEKGDIVSKANAMEFVYSKKGIEGEIHLEAQEIVKGLSTLADEAGERVNISEGIEGVYISYMNKCVPEDYKLTEQDKIDKENGTYKFSFGEDKTYVKHVQYMTWKQNNIAYFIASYNDEVTKDEMLKMAKEVIMK